MLHGAAKSVRRNSIRSCSRNGRSCQNSMMSGTILKTDAEARALVKVKNLPRENEKPSGACKALGAKASLCREASDGTLISSYKNELTVTDPDGKSRSFSAGDDGPPVAIAFGKEGRVLVATAGEGARKGSVRIYRPF